MSKKRLFEVMEKINSDFPKINEKLPDGAGSDVRMIKSLKTPSLKDAYENIDNQEEFNDAFELWFNSLGVGNEHKDKINIASTLRHIEEIMKEKGVKF